ncbi:hypothetical protein GIB67_024927 [Kingdonia uniflora]|uniref:Uncharacterized protein n=1 Tax=Kingdonia uniflora TaxID=39325 RepID=A0A7J7NYP1_9MAGN|nr:hypothetical protein GIB67_024927 [Kingdonia uniflora]
MMGLGEVVIAMKGHPGTGKSTIAHAIAAALKCPLIDKDDIRYCTKPLQQSSSLSASNQLLNDISYQVMYQIAKTQLHLGLNVIIDSPLSRKCHLDRLQQLSVGSTGRVRVIIIECTAQDEAEWRRRLEGRNNVDSNWHKPATWKELENLLEGYNGCFNYDVGDVPKLVIDTTSTINVEGLVSDALQFIFTHTKL